VVLFLLGGDIFSHKQAAWEEGTAVEVTAKLWRHIYGVRWSRGECCTTSIIEEYA